MGRTLQEIGDERAKEIDYLASMLSGNLLAVGVPRPLHRYVAEKALLYIKGGVVAIHREENPELYQP